MKPLPVDLTKGRGKGMHRGTFPATSCLFILPARERVYTPITLKTFLYILIRAILYSNEIRVIVFILGNNINLKAESHL